MRNRSTLSFLSSMISSQRIAARISRDACIQRRAQVNEGHLQTCGGSNILDQGVDEPLTCPSPAPDIETSLVDDCTEALNVLDSGPPLGIGRGDGFLCFVYSFKCLRDQLLLVSGMQPPYLPNLCLGESEI